MIEDPQFFVQGETVRREPRVYWVVHRKTGKIVSRVTTDRRQAERWLEKIKRGGAVPRY